MKSFLKKKEQQPTAESTPEKGGKPEEGPATSPAATAAASFDEEDDGGGGGGRNLFGKKKSGKKQQQQVESYDDEEEPSGKKSKKQSSDGGGRRRRCTCKRLLCASLCLAVLASVAVVVWRYGPWSKGNASVSSLSIESECPDCCNGLKSNCALPVNEVLFPMVHRAHSSYDNGFVHAHNNKGFEEALLAGYRALQLSTCTCERFLSAILLERDEEWGLGNSNLGFCHQACGLGVRDPKDVLTNLKTFVETNTREILIIELDMGEGSSADLRKALRKSGLLDYAYRPQDQYFIDEWPTMKQLIDDNARVLLFGRGDGTGSCPAYDCDDGIQYAGDHFARTATDGSDLDSCAPAELPGEATAGYFLMNHFENGAMKMPSPRKARELNSYQMLEARMEACGDARTPNLLAVEFWDEGDLLEFAEIENSRKNREGGEYASSGSEEEGGEDAAPDLRRG
mmetsp:Transcript_28430/g.60218  ORF Transcript_28430/g.60218 Transcript_28430/m.60218 type:complete len:455 (+) Transcript_28430:161-1525(+)|eukprot:CAMPEP_0172562524 /NCGR_PEP_ID=MMETSP1067-20121228/97225_1 /TAXON_ID=265564 ORGANISM="Thalassiosira punctigera, Strain Tpunct2005C2" /NCGR_SAMPLE_ID=MMETSP1067 /ASSEMBLY_ACC=CAM_ASM_000444 /LENGTH=454 /DNA_ID=CAMNT_0013352755 /DNA_START=96 /DNA_END=1460 /DNA_ORIENTATION=+